MRSSPSNWTSLIRLGPTMMGRQKTLGRCLLSLQPLVVSSRNHRPRESKTLDPIYKLDPSSPYSPPPLRVVLLPSLSPSFLLSSLYHLSSCSLEIKAGEAFEAKVRLQSLFPSFFPFLPWRFALPSLLVLPKKPYQTKPLFFSYFAQVSFSFFDHWDCYSMVPHPGS